MDAGSVLEVIDIWIDTTYIERRSCKGGKMSDELQLKLPISFSIAYTVRKVFKEKHLEAELNKSRPFR